MNENRMKEVLESIAQRNVPDSVNLWAQIAEKVERKKLMQTMRTRPVFALLLVLLALALISSVAYAIGRAAGFIPGVGIVDQSLPLRILAEPIVVEKDGIIITVSEVVADDDRTFVAYTVDGVVVPKMARVVCSALPSLQLPDGSALSIVNVDDGGPRGARAGSIIKLEQSITYSAVPAGVKQVTLTFPCILPEGTGPENWQIPLMLSLAPKDYATPAVEIGATFASSNPNFTMTQTAVPYGSGLYLEKVIELPDSYILVGNFTDAGDLPGALVIDLDPYADLPHMEDRLGNPVTFKVRDDMQPEINDRYWARYWAYEIAKPVQGPVTITLDQVNIAVSETTQFTLDAGPSPQMGQKWELDFPIHLRNYDYVMDSVEVIKDGYLFKYHSNIDVPQGLLFLNIVGYSAEQESSNVYQWETVLEYSESFTYAVPFPTGQLTVELTLTEPVPLQGPWTLTWMPPSK